MHERYLHNFILIFHHFNDENSLFPSFYNELKVFVVLFKGLPEGTSFVGAVLEWSKHREEKKKLKVKHFHQTFHQQTPKNQLCFLTTKVCPCRKRWSEVQIENESKRSRYKTNAHEDDLGFKFPTGDIKGSFSAR